MEAYVPDQFQITNSDKQLVTGHPRATAMTDADGDGNVASKGAIL